MNKSFSFYPNPVSSCKDKIYGRPICISKIRDVPVISVSSYYRVDTNDGCGYYVSKDIARLFKYWDDARVAEKFTVLLLQFMQSAHPMASDVKSVVAILKAYSESKKVDMNGKSRIYLYDFLHFVEQNSKRIGSQAQNFILLLWGSLLTQRALGSCHNVCDRFYMSYATLYKHIVYINMLINCNFKTDKYFNSMSGAYLSNMILSLCLC